jgi:pyridoxal phosphate enzyme (YggS family)
VQEAINKIEKLSDLAIEWHFIGPIQSNKTKYLAKYFSWVQSVDSLKILNRLNKQRLSEQGKLNVLLQLKVGGEDSKRGLSESELLAICQQHQDFENINIRGLMSIPAPTTVYSEQLKQFQQCQQVFQKMQSIIPVDTLSMGMSGDLEAAIESGSTMVRIGTDIFGQRELV